MFITNVDNYDECPESMKRSMNLDTRYDSLMQDFEKIFEDVPFIDWDAFEEEISTECFSGRYFVPIQNAFYCMKFYKDAAYFSFNFEAFWYSEKNLFDDLEGRIKRVADLLASDKSTYYKRVLLRGVRSSLKSMRTVMKRRYLPHLQLSPKAPGPSVSNDEL